MSEHLDAVLDQKGVYYKVKSNEYRSNCMGCGKGYHGVRWQAHHILPGMCFGGLDPFVQECLGVTDYDINKEYSMAGMPTLKGFLLHFSTATTPAKAGADNAAQLGRWKKIRIPGYQTTWSLPYPGDFPCHQPVSFGHVEYNKTVSQKLEKDIWKKLMRKNKKNQHMKPEDVKSLLEAAKDFFWSDLKRRGSGPGGGGLSGVKDNFLERNGTARSGWWKPMLMANVTVAPTPPSSFF